MHNSVNTTPISSSEVTKQLNCNWCTNLHVEDKFDPALYFMFHTGFMLYDEYDVNFINKFSRLNRDEFNIDRNNVIVEMTVYDNKTTSSNLCLKTYFAWYEMFNM